MWLLLPRRLVLRLEDVKKDGPCSLYDAKMIMHMERVQVSGSSICVKPEFLGKLVVPVSQVIKDTMYPRNEGRLGMFWRTVDVVYWSRVSKLQTLDPVHQAFSVARQAGP